MNEQAYRHAERALWSHYGARPTEHWVHLVRWKVRVRLQEVGEGTPILFLHGGPNSGSTWAPIAALLSGYRCLLLDRPGTGLSENRPLGLEQLPDLAGAMVADVLDALGIERAHVVASSFGGYLALHSAAATPERIDRMVQMACPAGAPGMGMPGFMKAVATPGLGSLLRLLPPTRGGCRMTLRQIGHRASLEQGLIPQVFLEWYLALQRHTDTMRNEGALIRHVATRRGWDPRLALPADLLAQASAPTLFWWGADDTFGGEAIARRLTAAMPDASLEMVPNAGHLPWLDDPRHAARAVAGFLGPATVTPVADALRGSDR